MDLSGELVSLIWRTYELFLKWHVAMLQAVHRHSVTVNAISCLLLPAVSHDEQLCVPFFLIAIRLCNFMITTATRCCWRSRHHHGQAGFAVSWHFSRRSSNRAWSPARLLSSQWWIRDDSCRCESGHIWFTRNGLRKRRQYDSCRYVIMNAAMCMRYWGSLRKGATLILTYFTPAFLDWVDEV